MVQVVVLAELFPGQVGAAYQQGLDAHTHGSSLGARPRRSRRRATRWYVKRRWVNSRPLISNQRWNTLAGSGRGRRRPESVGARSGADESGRRSRCSGRSLWWEQAGQDSRRRSRRAGPGRRSRSWRPGRRRGRTARAGGVIYAADTAVQKAAGIEDSVAELINYYQTVSHHRLEPRLLRTSAEGTRGLIDWLGQLGITWDPHRLYVAGLEFRPRGHLPTGDRMGFGPAGGAMIIAALWTAVQAAGVPVRTGVRVASLQTAPDGAGTGVVTEAGERLEADSVVLATGGFGAALEMLAELWPEATEQGDWHWYLGPDTNVGDGIAMAREVGGVVVNPGRARSWRRPTSAASTTRHPALAHLRQQRRAAVHRRDRHLLRDGARHRQAAGRQVLGRFRRGVPGQHGRRRPRRPVRARHRPGVQLGRADAPPPDRGGQGPVGPVAGRARDRDRRQRRGAAGHRRALQRRRRGRPGTRCSRRNRSICARSARPRSTRSSCAPRSSA